MPYIPAEQLNDILPKLSPKDLVRFSFASKEWKDTITNPKFATTHLQRSIATKSDPAIFVIPSATNAAFYYSLKFSDNDTKGKLLKIIHGKKHPPVHSVNIVGYCHGLICIRYDRDEFRLWNPSIRRFKKIPSGPLGNSDTYDGFGYDSVNDDYKIVRIPHYYFNRHENLQVYAYSLKSDVWKRIANLPRYYYNFEVQPNAMFLNGALHWMVTHETHRTRVIILTLDLASEQFGELSMPAGYFHDDDDTFNKIFDHKTRTYRISLVVVGGYLCVYPKQVLNRAWIMKEYGVEESWDNLYLFDGKNGSNCRPVMLSNCGKKILVEENYHCLAWYDLEKNARTVVTIDGMPSTFSTVLSMENIHLLRS